jgi:hypothetical protein
VVWTAGAIQNDAMKRYPRRSSSSSVSTIEQTSSVFGGVEKGGYGHHGQGRILVAPVVGPGRGT